jgi:hypothetical protein
MARPLHILSPNSQVVFVSQEPVWATGTQFTDHSYRGFSADGKSGELLLLNIHSESGDQFVSYRNRQGQWQAQGSIRFPIVLYDNNAGRIAVVGYGRPVRHRRG